MKRFALMAALSASTLAISAGASFADYTLHILHMNDWHSRIEPINAFDSTCSAEDETAGKCFGGAARLVTAVRERREALQGENTLFLNAGDNFQGSLFYTTYKGAAEAEFLNQMGVDAMTVGNHEFDDSDDALATFIDAVEFPVVSSNISASAPSSLVDKIDPFVVLDVGGEKIGIVGAVPNDTADLSSPSENVTIEEDVAKITEAVQEVKAQGVDKIIALTHVGYPRDLEAIAKIPDVDVVVGGHSHTLLHNTDDAAAGPYPTMVENPGGYQVPVVQAASYSKYLGELEVTFDENGVVTAASGDPILLDATIEPDPAVVARVQELRAPIEEAMGVVVSETTAPIDGSRETCRAGECEMGVLVTDAMLDRTADQGVTIAITNGGGLRASIDQGEVTMGEVVEVLPFQNTLATMELSGADIVASLEQGVSAIEEGAGKFPQVAGLRYSFDRSTPANQGRIESVEVRENGQWVPLDPNKTYTVATNNFMRGGGDGYELFETNAQNAYDYGPGLEQVVANYLAENRPYTPKLEGRITEVTGAAEPAATEDASAAASETDAAAAPADAAPAADAAADTATAAADESAADPIEPVTEPADEAAAAASEPETAVPPADTNAAPGTLAANPDPAGQPAEAAETAQEMATPPADADTEGSAADMAAAPADENAADPIEPVTEPAEQTAMAQTAAEMAASAAPTTHTIVAGDSLWKLAARFYGDGREFTRLRDANPDVDPENLVVGETLTVPPAN
jgi:5'-nucleotidase/UDP-sugar diphosphatase